MRRFTTRLALLLLFHTACFSSCLARDNLTQDQPLIDGETLVSAGGSFVLGFFSPNGSTSRYVGIWYNKVSVRTVVWVANRQKPIDDLTGILAISSNGSLIITSQNSRVISWTVSMNIRNPIAQLLDSGNFVVGEASGGSFAWQSFDHPTDTLLPGMKLGWNLTTGLNRNSNLTAWLSTTDPSLGHYSLTVDLRGDPQLFLMYGTGEMWRGGPWDGLRFVGLPEMDNEDDSSFNFTFVDEPDEVYYTFYTLDSSVISRLVLNSTGSVQRLVWLQESKQWNIFWQRPDSQCDPLSTCGPFGVCDANNSPVCSCLPGFTPKSPVNWALRDGTAGCVRKTPLDCRNRTDGFMKLSGAKLPDTRNATVNMSMSLDECGAECLSNCLCTAYASANIGGGASGCVIWTSGLTDLSVFETGGQDLYFRLAAADLGKYSIILQKKLFSFG